MEKKFGNLLLFVPQTRTAMFRHPSKVLTRNLQNFGASHPFRSLGSKIKRASEELIPGNRRAMLHQIYIAMSSGWALSINLR